MEIVYNSNNEIERQERILLRPWLESLIESGRILGLEWVDDAKSIFRVPWKHRSKKTWSENQSSVFLEWARNTGRWSEGDPVPNYAQLKTRLRCAFNKAPDIEELKELHQIKSDNPYKVYRFLPRRESKLYSCCRKTYIKATVSRKRGFLSLKMDGSVNNPDAGPVLQRPRYNEEEMQRQAGVAMIQDKATRDSSVPEDALYIETWKRQNCPDHQDRQQMEWLLANRNKQLLPLPVEMENRFSGGIGHLSGKPVQSSAYYTKQTILPPLNRGTELLSNKPLDVEFLEPPMVFQKQVGYGFPIKTTVVEGNCDEVREVERVSKLEYPESVNEDHLQNEMNDHLYKGPPKDVEYISTNIENTIEVNALTEKNMENAVKILPEIKYCNTEDDEVIKPKETATECETWRIPLKKRFNKTVNCDFRVGARSENEINFSAGNLPPRTNATLPCEIYAETSKSSCGNAVKSIDVPEMTYVRCSTEKRENPLVVSCFDKSENFDEQENNRSSYQASDTVDTFDRLLPPLNSSDNSDRNACLFAFTKNQKPLYEKMERPRYISDRKELAIVKPLSHESQITKNRQLSGDMTKDSCKATEVEEAIDLTKRLDYSNYVHMEEQTDQEAEWTKLKLLHHKYVSPSGEYDRYVSPSETFETFSAKAVRNDKWTKSGMVSSQKPNSNDFPKNYESLLRNEREQHMSGNHLPNFQCFSEKKYLGNAPLEDTFCQRNQLKIVSNHQSRIDSNHQSRIDSSHQSRIDSDHNSRIYWNHQSRMDSKHQLEIDTNHQSRIDSNHQSKIDSNHQSRIDLNLQSRIDSNHQSRIDPNHQSRIDSNHHSRIDLNHQLRIDSNHQSRIDSNHQSRIDPNHQSRIDSNHHSRIDLNHQLRIDSNHQSRIDSNHQSRIDSNHQSRIDLNHQSRIDPNHQSRIDPNHQSRIDSNPPGLSSLSSTFETSAIWIPQHQRYVDVRTRIESFQQQQRQLSPLEVKLLQSPLQISNPGSKEVPWLPRPDVYNGRVLPPINESNMNDVSRKDPQMNEQVMYRVREREEAAIFMSQKSDSRQPTNDASPYDTRFDRSDVCLKNGSIQADNLMPPLLPIDPIHNKYGCAKFTVHEPRTSPVSTSSPDVLVPCGNNKKLSPYMQNSEGEYNALDQDMRGMPNAVRKLLMSATKSASSILPPLDRA